MGDECPALLPAVSQAATNGADISGANNFLQPGTELAAGQFGEAAINLTEALKAAGGNPTQPDPCVSFGYMWMHSRSAPSITSNQQDYILPTDAINVANCAVTGTKFHDLDGDGSSQEGNEPGLGGWTMFADYNNDGTLDNDKVAPFVNDNDGVAEAGEEEPYDVTAPVDGNDLRPLGSYTIANIQNGTWNIREAGQAGWNCTFPSPCVHQVVMTGSLVENINFGNNEPGKVRVVKSTTPDGDATDFDFDPSANLAANNFTRRDGQAAQEYVVQAGTYTVTELAEAGWDLDSIVCSDGDSTGTGSVATFVVAAGETVTCTFDNIKRATVRVVKSTTPDGDTTDFDFDPLIDPGGRQLHSPRQPGRAGVQRRARLLHGDGVRGGRLGSRLDPVHRWRLDRHRRRRDLRGRRGRDRDVHVQQRQARDGPRPQVDRSRRRHDGVRLRSVRQPLG